MSRTQGGRSKENWFGVKSQIFLFVMGWTIDVCSQLRRYLLRSPQNLMVHRYLFAHGWSSRGFSLTMQLQHRALLWGPPDPLSNWQQELFAVKCIRRVATAAWVQRVLSCASTRRIRFKLGCIANLLLSFLAAFLHGKVEKSQSAWAVGGEVCVVISASKQDASYMAQKQLGFV